MATRTNIRTRATMVAMTHPFVPDFPGDLVQAQSDWYATYRQLADPSGTQTAALRRHLLRLSGQIAQHPFWDRTPNGPAARMALKQAAWSTTVR
jgi:hypothetical protein